VPPGSEFVCLLGGKPESHRRTGARRAEKLDACATSARLDHGIAKLSVIVPQKGLPSQQSCVGQYQRGNHHDR
jgi:hypothetical protein